jgi:hypothetical protein
MDYAQPEENITITRTVTDEQTGNVTVSLTTTTKRVGQRFELFITDILYQEAFSNLALQALAQVVAETFLLGRHRNISVLVGPKQTDLDSFFVHLDQTVGMHYHRTTGSCYVTPDYEMAYSPYKLSDTASSFYLLHCMPVPLKDLSTEAVIQMQTQCLAKWLLTGEQAVN